MEFTQSYHRALERDEALVQKWLKSEYPKIKKMGYSAGADISFSDAAQYVLDHRAGTHLGQEGETPVVNNGSIAGICSPDLRNHWKGRMRFMIGRKAWRGERRRPYRIPQAIAERRDTNDLPDR